MDENGDGYLTEDELLVQIRFFFSFQFLSFQKAYQPINRVHVIKQIKKLFVKVDDAPQDHILTLEEIQNHADAFTDPYILETEKVLHDEI